MSLTGLTPQSYLLGTLISTASLKAGEVLASQEKSWRACVVVFGILGMGGVLATPLSRCLSQWTGTVLTHTQSLLIFGVVATFKAIGIACERFLFLKEVSDYEEVRSLYDIQLRPLHTHFTAHPDKFQKLDLHIQTILNKRFSEQKFEPIASQTFSEIGSDYTKEELDFLVSGMDLSKIPSLEDRQKIVLFLYENNSPPIAVAAREDFDMLHTAKLTEETISTLSLEQIRWIRMALRNSRPVPQDSKAFQALVQAFFNAKLHPPENDPRFFLQIEDHLHPTSYSPLLEEEKYLIPWLKNYYAYQKSKWIKLPLQTQMNLNVLFSGQIAYYDLIPRESDFPWVDKHLDSFHDLFSNKPYFWHTLSLPVQHNFNESFEKAKLDTFGPIEETSAEEFEQVLMMFTKSPLLFDELTESQRRTICERAFEMWLPFQSELIGKDPSGNDYYRMPNGDLWRKKKNGNVAIQKYGTNEFHKMHTSGDLRAFSDPHTRYRWNEDGVSYGRPFRLIEPFVITMNTLLDEKQAQTSKTLARGVYTAVTVLTVGAIWSFCHILMHGPVIDMQQNS